MDTVKPMLPSIYRASNLVERFFNQIKHCRQVATRYDKLAANYLAFVQLASIRYGYAFLVLLNGRPAPAFFVVLCAAK